MGSSQLRHCDHCAQSWPKDARHALRGLAWLDPLPRNITPSNGDIFLHDGAHGGDRFLMAEIKSPWEPAPQHGQNWLLRALAKQSGWTVRLLHGTLDRLTMYVVTPERVDADRPIRITPAGFRASVVDWLNGEPWRDAPGRLSLVPKASTGHVCGWAKVDDTWTCIQDYYAVGDAPETACGATWTEAS